MVLEAYMNNHEKADVTQLEAMSLDKARREIASGTFGDIGSQRHDFCSSWLAAKEASDRESREGESLRIARRANKLACAAMILSVITAIGVVAFQWWLAPKSPMPLKQSLGIVDTPHTEIKQ